MKQLIIGFLALTITLISTSVEAQDWETVETFKGSGITNTAPFTIDDTHWRINYESGSDMSAGHIFQLYLEQPNKGSSFNIIANQTNKKGISGKSNIYDTGTFYLKVNAANGDWEIKVQVPKD